VLDKGADPNAEGGSTVLTCRVCSPADQDDSRRLPPQQFCRSYEGGNGRNNTWGSRYRRVHVPMARQR